MWVNQDGTFPYVTRETWRTRGWLLVKKCERYDEISANDRRVAAMLLMDPKHPRTDDLLRGKLEVIADGADNQA